jgi:hypothetical protein
MLQRPELRKNAASLLRWDESFTAGGTEVHRGNLSGPAETLLVTPHIYLL